jgi:hypothetical protein
MMPTLQFPRQFEGRMSRTEGVLRLRAMSDGFADVDQALGWQRGTSLLWALNTLVPGWEETPGSVPTSHDSAA